MRSRTPLPIIWPSNSTYFAYSHWIRWGLFLTSVRLGHLEFTYFDTSEFRRAKCALLGTRQLAFSFTLLLLSSLNVLDSRSGPGPRVVLLPLPVACLSYAVGFLVALVSVMPL